MRLTFRTVLVYCANEVSANCTSLSCELRSVSTVGIRRVFRSRTTATTASTRHSAREEDKISVGNGISQTRFKLHPYFVADAETAQIRSDRRQIDFEIHE